jgi:hypothetical protein
MLLLNRNGNLSGRTKIKYISMGENGIAMQSVTYLETYLRIKVYIRILFLAREEHDDDDDDEDQSRKT